MNFLNSLSIYNIIFNQLIIFNFRCNDIESKFNLSQLGIIKFD